MRYDSFAAGTAVGSPFAAAAAQLDDWRGRCFNCNGGCFGWHFRVS